MIHMMICMFTESVAYVFGVVEVVWYVRWPRRAAYSIFKTSKNGRSYHDYF